MPRGGDGKWQWPYGAYATPLSIIESGNQHNAILDDLGVELDSLFNGEFAEGAIGKDKLAPGAIGDVHSALTYNEMKALGGSVGYVKTSGRNLYGDGGCGLFKWQSGDHSADVAADPLSGIWVAPDSDPSGASGAWERIVSGPVRPEWWGAAGDAAVNDSAAIQAAVDYVCNNTEKTLLFEKKYLIDDGVGFSNPYDVKVIAVGAEFYTNSDILMFDLFSKCDAAYEHSESVQNFVWRGGKFKCNIASPTKATAFRAFGFRRVILEPEHFDGFKYDFMLGGKDTIFVRDYKSYLAGTSIFFPPWSTYGGPLNVFIEKAHISTADRFVDAYVPLTNCALQDFSVNAGSGYSIGGAIRCRKFVLLGIDNDGSGFQAGETITGGTSGATATLEEVYTHPFPFEVSQPSTYLVLKDRGTALFQPGETITGGTSGATATIPQSPGLRTDSYITQNYVWSDFHIRGANHFEAGSGASGCTSVWLEDCERRGNTPVSFTLELGSLGQNGGGSTGLFLDGISNVSVSGRFSQTSGNTPIKFSSRTSGVKLLNSSFFSTGAIDLNGMARSELDLSDVGPQPTAPMQIWNQQAVSTTSSDTLLDIAGIGSFSVAGIKPRGYALTVRATDSGSATSIRFRYFQPGTAWNFKHELRTNSSVPDFCAGEVLADSAGRIAYDAVTSGSGSMKVDIAVTRCLW